MSFVNQGLMNKDIMNLIWTNATDAIFAIDYNGAIIYANPAFTSMLGWDTDELDEIKLPIFISNMTEREHSEFLAQLKNGKNFPYTIMKRRHKDGALLDVLASYWSVNNEQILAIGMYKDYTEQIYIQKCLEESEYNYRTLVENLTEAIVKQRNGKVEFINSAGLKLFGIKNSDQILNRSFWDYVSSDKKEALQTILNTAYEGSNMYIPHTVIDKFTRHDGIEFWAEVKVIPIGTREKPDIQIVFRDVTEKEFYKSQLEQMAYHDDLTGLKNRRIFTEIVEKSLERAKMSNGKVVIMYMDIDDFKSINDRYGHAIGDQLLQRFSDRLNRSVRNGDVLCRVGGDEFLVLLNNIDNEKEIINIAQRMIETFEDPYQLNGYNLRVTSSIGIAIFPESGINTETLIQCADQALYLAKESKNNYMIYKIK